MAEFLTLSLGVMQCNLSIHCLIGEHHPSTTTIQATSTNCQRHKYLLYHQRLLLSDNNGENRHLERGLGEIAPQHKRPHAQTLRPHVLDGPFTDGTPKRGILFDV